MFSVFQGAFDNPYLVGKRIRRHGESLHVNSAYGVRSFLSLEQIRSRDFLKGGTAVFLLTMTGKILGLILIKFTIEYIL